MPTFFCIVFLAFSTVQFAACSHPPDSVLEANFYRHEGDFNKLIRMSNEDPRVVRIAPDFTWLDTNAAWPRPDSELGFSRARWDEYRRLFKKLGVKTGVSRSEDAKGTIFLPVSLFGMVTGGDEKGYAYCAKEPSPIVDSLDEIRIEVKSLQPVYKRIKGNWYLYYLWDD